MNSATWIDDHEVLKTETETTDTVEPGDQWILVPPFYTSEAPTMYLHQGAVLRYDLVFDNGLDDESLAVAAENLNVPVHIAVAVLENAFEALGLEDWIKAGAQ